MSVQEVALQKVNEILADPKYHDILAILKGFRNGLVYGVKVRAPHALIMSLIFHRTPWQTRLKFIYKATKQHALNLAKFVTIYKTVLLLQRRFGASGAAAGQGKPRSVDTFIAGLVGGWYVFGDKNAVNEQIVLYVVSRVISSFLPRAPSAGSAATSSIPAKPSERGGLVPPGYPYPKSQQPDPKIFKVYAAIAWALKPDPLLGHLRHIPSKDEPRVYRDWGIQLGSDIISMNVMGQVIVVVNSLDAATELLAKRSSIYSDRPELPMLNDERLVGWGNNTGNIRYGENWRTQRRLTHSVLHKKASEDFWPVMIKQTRLALQRLLDQPENYTEEFRRMSGATLLSSVYGYEVTSSDDELVKVVESAVHKISEAALAGNFYVNTVTWLKYVPSWFPGAGWKRTANAWRKEIDEMVNVPYDWAKEQIASGSAAPSVIRQMLSQLSNKEGVDEKPHEKRIRWATTTLFAAGTDTSVATVIVFVLAMVLHPDVQARAQAEIDTLLGQSRLPEMTDRESLPYVCCIVKEVLRWWPVFPLGVPHAATEDDVYCGYLIPKGSTIIGNTWAICNDPTIYPEPETFRPERFLDPSVPSAPGFGFGRRSCPGIHFAESTLFITMCTLLMVFNIRPKQDGKGNDLLPKIKKGPNLMISYPIPFDCSIAPRSEKHETLLRQWVDL